jgi:molecular chaperone GrpE (heat shock protein)
MAHDKSTTENHSEAGGNRRFRMPKLFADSDDTAPETEETAERIAQRASALGVTLPAPMDEEVIVAANRPYEGAPRASVLRMSPEEAAAEMKAEAAASSLEARTATATSSATATATSFTNAAAVPAKVAPAQTSQNNTTRADANPVVAARNDAEHSVNTDDVTSLSGTSTQNMVGQGVARLVPSASAASASLAVPARLEAAAGTAALTQPEPGESAARNERATPTDLPAETKRVLEAGGHVLRKLDSLESGMELMTRLMQEICDRGTAQEKVFDTLHSELQDYKNDFIYEHLKPVVRPLLFLYDSLEQFEDELAQQERPQVDERRRGLSPALVRQNMAFFREQLVEALRICEVTPMQTPEGVFDPKCHKAVDIALVEQEQENMIQRVVRSGWYLNGHVFRPAEVVVGRTTADYNAQIWNYGHGKNGERPASGAHPDVSATTGNA